MASLTRSDVAALVGLDEYQSKQIAKLSAERNQLEAAKASPLPKRIALQNNERRLQA
jgi:hypothetical protein